MPPSDPDQDDLLSRLNALKPSHALGSSGTAAGAKALKHEPDVDDLTARFTAHSRSLKHEPDVDNLARRFQALGGRKAVVEELPGAPVPQLFDVSEGGDTKRNEEDDQTIEKLLEELDGDGATWHVTQEEEAQARDLLRQAHTTLEERRRAEEQDDTEDRSAEKDGGPPDTGGKHLEHERAVTEITEKAMAQAAIDRMNGGSSDSEGGENEGDQPDFALPSAPTELRSAPPPPVSKDGEEPGTLLPSAPTFHPALKSSVLRAPDRAAEDVETWCIICNDDATLRCEGCDGDLYCDLCWFEGHRGESAGFEERRHKAVQYEKGKKQTKTAARAESRVKVGA